MERRVTSHTEEEEMNQRRHLLALARKGDENAVTKLMELYQVKVYSGNSLKSIKIQKLPPPPPSHKHKEGLPTAKKPAPRPLPPIAQSAESLRSKPLKSSNLASSKKLQVQKAAPKQGQSTTKTKKVVVSISQSVPKGKPKTKPKTQAKPKSKPKVQAKKPSKLAVKPTKGKSKTNAKTQTKGKSKAASSSRVKVKPLQKSTTKSSSKAKTKQKTKPRAIAKHK
jgi:hypothetical protein